MMKAWVLLVHGDRNGDAKLAMNQMIAHLQNRNGKLFLRGAQLLSMDEELFLTNVLKDVYQQGFSEIEILPWFLFAGPHVKMDIPELVHEFQERNPSISIRIQPPLGEDPLFEEIIAKRLSFD